MAPARLPARIRGWQDARRSCSECSSSVGPHRNRNAAAELSGLFWCRRDMRTFAATVVVVLLVGCGGGSSPLRPTAQHAAGPCEPPVVHHTAYPGHGKGLDGLPWI